MRLAYRGQVALYYGAYIALFNRCVQVGIVGDLVVNAPDVVGLLVHQHGGAGVARAVKPGAPLGGKGGVQLDIDNHKLAGEGLAFEFQAQRLADKTLATIGGDQPVGIYVVFAQVIGHRQRHAIRARLQQRDAAGPADVDQLRELARLVQQKLLDVVLRNIDHRRQLVAGRMRHAKAQYLLVFVVTTPGRPRQSLGHEGIEHTQTLQYLQTAARDANGTAAFAHRVVGLNDDAGYTLLGQT